jgi:hypothetical protein
MLVDFARNWAFNSVLRHLVTALIVVSMLASTTVAAYAAGGLSGNLNGVVVSDQGAPLAGVTVSLSAASGTLTQVTDAQGAFHFLSVVTDTYTLALTKGGYSPRSMAGITIIGDGSVDLGRLILAKALTTIATVRSTATNSSFHPDQTTDSYAITGQRVQQVLGNKYSTNEAELIQSAPGVIQSFDSGSMGGGLSIRGSLAVELGYEYDGIPFSAPFFNENGSQGFVNGINGGTGGEIQVVPGAGDPTQGNIGAGTINTIVPRGTYPGSGDIDTEVGGPFYNHTLNFDYGFATPNGKFSNYVSISATRYVPSFGPPNVDPAVFGAYFGTSLGVHNDIVDNMVFKFGKNNNQSFQILGRVANLEAYNGLGGLSNLSYVQGNPGFLGFFAQFLDPNNTAGGNAYVASLIPNMPYSPQNPNGSVTQPEITTENPLNLLKFAYTNNLNSTTFLSLTAYNWSLFQGGTNYTNFQNAGFFGTGSTVIGGTRTGEIAQLVHQFGEYNTVTLEGDYNNSKPYWTSQTPGLDLYGLLLTNPSLGSPNAIDWQLPANTNAPISATNACPSGPSGCYIYNYLFTSGKWTGKMPQIPNAGINYHGTDQQIWGVGLRDQYSPSDRLHLDLGLRIDGENNRFGPTPYGNTTTSDVSPASLSNAFVKPSALEPRLAVAYQLGQNDAVRFSYGRSVQFFFGQTLGTPWDLSGISPLLASIPAKPAALPNCGSGFHGPGTGYTQNPGITNADNPNGGYFFPCTSYAAQLFWGLDQNLDAPDLGGFGPPTYSNFDVGYTHRFTRGAMNGWSTKLTAYTERGFNVEQNVLLLNGPPNPITGQSSASVFTTTASGIEKKFGIEAQLTTPDVRDGHAGVSGFLTFDYINALSNTPPVAGSNNLPIMAGQLLLTGQMFKAGYVPPVSGVLGLTYHFKDGITITPTLFANGGFPFGVGQSSIGFVNGQLMNTPETNYGAPNLPYAGASGPGNAYNASYYVDPQVPGGYLAPNIAASRGYAEPKIAGNKLTPAELFANLDIEVPISKKATLGFQVFNLTDNHYGFPGINTQYQPVANGVAGPATGQLANANPYNANTYTVGAANEYYQAGSTLPFYNSLYGVGTSFNVYFRTKI